MDFELSPKAKELSESMWDFLNTRVLPAEAEYYDLRAEVGPGDPRLHVLPPIVEELKVEARKRGLWNLFLPEVSGLTNVDYASLAEISGWSMDLLPEAINCQAPDSGNMETLFRFGTDEQKSRWLPKIATGELRLQSMGVTEPTTGTDTTRIKTTAVRQGDRYVINGQKVWISRVQHSDLMILLARTTPIDQVARKSEGMSIFVVDLRDAIGHGLTVRPIPNLVNHETNELFFENLEIPAENLIGEEGQGFKYILDGLNAERALIAAECIGDGYWFIDRVTAYTKDRVVFGRPIGQNQGVQFPIAEAYIEVEAANLMRWKACELFDARKPCGAEANMAKYLAAKASWEAANACLQFHGGFGFACEYDVERKFRETRLYQVAPISTNLILSYVAEHVLGLPRSF